MSDEMVYVAGTRSAVYHTERDCQALQHDVRERRLSVLEAWDYESCKHCSGDREIRNFGEQLKTKLSKADPEDLGLSPNGERGGVADD